MNPDLEKILQPAYNPCRGFSHPCSAMRWEPETGHIPRGFWGALGSLEEVRLVMVLAEPGYPKDGRPQTGLESAFDATGRTYKLGTDIGHSNVRYIVGLCFPDRSFVEAMRKVWITESVLCSIPKGDPTGKVPREVENHCAKTFLLPQLRLFHNPIVAAMGGKAYSRLKGPRRRQRGQVQCSLSTRREQTQGQGVVAAVGRPGTPCRQWAGWDLD